MNLSASKRAHLIPFRGVPLPHYFQDNMKKVEEFEADKSDILIATYPKAGTTWIQQIVDCVIHGADVKHRDHIPLHHRIPFFESFFPEMPSGLELLDKIPSPKVIKTHLPFQLIPTSFLQKQCKIIYCARNAKDNVVSFFHFDQMNKMQPEPGSWEEFLQKFLVGNVTYGLWHDHVKGWWEQRENYPILYIFYENIKEDPRREIKKVAEFLGKELSSKDLDNIVAQTSFNAMKHNPMTNYSTIPLDVLDQKISPFMRKGIVGDWKTHFTVAQNQMFEEDYRRRMAGSTLRFQTELKTGDTCPQ